MVKPLEGSGLLLKEVRETIQNEAKEQKGGFLSILSDTLGSSLLGNMIRDKGIIRARYGSKDLESKKDKEIIKASYGSKDFYYHLNPYLISRYKKMIRMNPDLMEFILEIIYLIK